MDPCSNHRNTDNNADVKGKKIDLFYIIGAMTPPSGEYWRHKTVEIYRNA